MRAGRNAELFAGDGGKYGVADANIENGMSAERAAWIILDGIAAGQREIPVAEGAELDILIARARDPERAFAALSAQGARLAAARGR